MRLTKKPGKTQIPPIEASGWLNNGIDVWYFLSISVISVQFYEMLGLSDDLIICSITFDTDTQETTADAKTDDTTEKLKKCKIIFVCGKY